MRFPDFRISMVFCLISALVACTPAPPPAQVSAEHAGAEPDLGSVTASTPSIAFLRGYYESQEGGLFTACGETSRRHVISIDEASAAAMTTANATLDRPRFLMAEGNLSGKDNVDIGRFNLISGDAWNCESRLNDVVAAARGSEILWNLEVTPAAISFAAAPGAAPDVHAFAGIEESSDGLVLKSTDPEFSATLKAGACVETMTDTTFGWSIEVTYKEQTFDGCAWRGLAKP